MREMIDIKNIKLVAAPMAGYSDHIYRRFAHRFGADIVFTEMISAEGFARDNAKTINMMLRDIDAAPTAIQFFTHSPEAMLRAAAKVSNFGFRMLDINMGCPVAKVMKRNAGAALLANPSLAREVVHAAMESRLPVSVKMRSGMKDEREWQSILAMLLDFESIGICAATIHPRAASQQFRGKANRALIAEAVKTLKIPVWGSGDIFLIDDIREMMLETNAAGAVIARGAVGNFELFSQARAYLRDESIPEFPVAQRAKTICDFIEEEVLFRGERSAVKWSRKFLVALMRDFPGARDLRAKLPLINTIEDVRNMLSAMCAPYCRNAQSQSASEIGIAG